MTETLRNGNAAGSGMGDTGGPGTRVKWVDTLKFVCIFFVVLAHLEVKSAVWNRFFLPFFLPGFLFSSGYVYTHRTGFRAHLIKKCRQLLVPWFAFSTANILLSQVLTFSDSRLPLAEALKWNFLQIRGLHDGMWFVSALFTAFIVFYFFVESYEKAKRKSEAAYRKYLCIALGLHIAYFLYLDAVPADLFPYGVNRLPWHLEYIPFALFFMFLGYLMRERGEALFRCLDSAAGRVLLIAAFLTVRFVPFLFHVTMGRVADIPYTLVCHLLALASLVSVCRMTDAAGPILYIGRNTLIYFALHSKAIALAEAILKKTAGAAYSRIAESGPLAFVYLPVMAAAITAVLIIPAWVINRYFPFMMCRGYERRRR